MDIHEEHGYETPETDPCYTGVLFADGKILAQIEYYYNGQKMKTEYDFDKHLEMSYFESEIVGGVLARETEIKPLVDLTFATIAFTQGRDAAVRADGTIKSNEEFLRDGLKKLKDVGRIPPETYHWLKGLFDANKDLWPQEILPLFRTVHELIQKPQALYRSGLS